MIQPIRAAALAGAALLVTACGDRGGDAAANDGAAALTGATNDFAIGNDASAMETVGSGEGMGPAPALPTGNMAAPTPSNNVGSGNLAAPAAGSAGGAPGGDRGGNTAESNVSGM